MGADVIGSSYNCMPEVFMNILKAIEENDINKARGYQTIANDIIEIFGNITIMYPKTGNAMVGWIVVE